MKQLTGPALLAHIIETRFERRRAILAERLDVTIVAIGLWLSGKSPIPPLRALQIEQCGGESGEAARLQPKCALLQRRNGRKVG